MMSKPMGALFGVLTLVAILAIAPSAFAQESETTVNISAGAGSSPNCAQSSNCFDPDTTTVAPGTTVEWQNNDKVSHTVTSGNPSDNQTGTIFDSSLIAVGKSFSFTFNNPGTYNYFCQVHPWMTGEVIVSASAATTPSTTSNSMPSGMSMPENNSATTTPSTESTMPSSTTPSSTPETDQSSSNTAPATETTTPAPETTPVTSQPTETTPAPVTSPSTSSTDDGQVTGWASGIIVAAIMSGVGIWSAVRRR